MLRIRMYIPTRVNTYRHTLLHKHTSIHTHLYLNKRNIIYIEND